MLQCYFLLAPRTAQITRRTIPVTTSTPSRSIGQPPDHTPFIMLPKLKPEPPPFPIIASNSFAQVLPRCMYPGIRCARSVREAKRPRSRVQSDVVVYGTDLADYFTLELGLARPALASRPPRHIELWSDLPSSLI